MQADTFISLRKPLRGAVDDLLDAEQMACVKTQEGLVNLIDALARYREEGKALFPEVYLVDDLAAVLLALPGGEHVPIGNGQRDAGTMAKALKQCAPLAQDGWVVYIHREQDKFSFGIMRSGIHLLSVPIADVLVKGGDALIPAILVRQIAPNLVEVQGVLRSSLLVHFGATRESAMSPVQALDGVVTEIVRDVPVTIREQSHSFFSRLLMRALNESHGALIAVARKSQRTLPPALRDGIELRPAVDVQNLISLLLETPDCLGNTRLKAAEVMISGMISSDGITVFGSDSTVRGYNIFVKHPQKMQQQGPKFGGARRRTFQVLANMVGKKLTCAFMQSQDGNVAFERSTDA